MPDIFALVDCNNFYASCERLFLPGLERRPLVVLSNNDGCVIARTEEAKALGIGMGVPVFKIQQVIRDHQVQVFSTNYALYGDISQRVMNILSTQVPDLEIYSIDEAFLDLSHIPADQLKEAGKAIRDKILQCTGIPVSIGIAGTKTLAKAANHLAKSNKAGDNVLVLSGKQSTDHYLEMMQVSDIWGVGEKFNAFFRHSGIGSALDLKNTDAYRLREHLGLAGQRLVLELNGIPCYPFHSNPDQKKEICSSRSFGHPVESYDELEEATTSYAAKVAFKLRKQGSLAQTLLVFVMTNKYASGPQYVNYQVVHLSQPSNQTQVILHYCRKALAILFRKGYKYKKSGVIVSELVPDSGTQTALWGSEDSDRADTILEVMDDINRKAGMEKLRFAVQGSGKSWKMKQHSLSPHYTTRWEELLTIDLDAE